MPMSKGSPKNDADSVNLMRCTGHAGTVVSVGAGLATAGVGDQVTTVAGAGAVGVVAGVVVAPDAADRLKARQSYQ